MKKDKTSGVIEQIDSLPMPSVLTDCFNRYAKAVIMDRAIPDARDGLKPVQRRIVYTMWEEGNLHSKPTRKCARTVGLVIGKYHPHGDSSVYDAMVRLSQDWKMSIPLLEFQGNNGSIDNDPAAAYRYTEARLAAAADLMVQDLDKNTVDMALNFDDTEYEPTVLPARFPNLLVNGANGIAVGAATYIPPHNLGEVIDATVYRLEHKRATVADLRQFILGPDFPTGGVIDDPAALDTLYETGVSSFFVHADVDIESEPGKIIISEIPYNTVKGAFVADLDKRMVDGKLDAIQEIRDESTDQVRVVIEIKKDAAVEPVLNYYRQKGALRSTFAANMLAIDKGHPKTMNLLEMIDAYVDHQKEVVTRRSQFDLKKKTWRLGIVNGLIKAISILDEVIELIRRSSGKEDSKKQLIERYGFTAEQAEAIVTLQLYRLSNTDVTILQQEAETLKQEIAELQAILGSEERLIRLLVRDLKEIKKNYPTPRRTKILAEKIKMAAVDQRSLIAREQVVVVLTKDGYIKRTSVRSYEASLQAKNSDPYPKIKVGDRTVLCRECSTHDSVLFLTTAGNYYVVPVHEIGEAKWKEEGKHLNNLVNLPAEEKIVAAFAVGEFKPGLFVVLLSSGGKIKRTPLADFAQSRTTARGLRCLPLLSGDQLAAAAISHGNSDILIVNQLGLASRFHESEVPVVSLKAAGVKAMNQGKEMAPLAACLTFASEEHTKLLLLTDMRAARLLQSTAVPALQRLGAKTALVRVFKSAPMKIVSLTKVARRKGGDNLVSISTDIQPELVDIDKLDTALLGSGLKSNLPLGKATIVGRNEEGELIDADTPVEQAPNYSAEPVKARDDAPTQLSLFDMFDEEK